MAEFKVGMRVRLKPKYRNDYQAFRNLHSDAGWSDGDYFAWEKNLKDGQVVTITFVTDAGGYIRLEGLPWWLYYVGAFEVVEDAADDSVEMEDAPVDMINHPPHYKQHPSGVEAIDICEHMMYNLGAAMKYIWRADYKHGDGGEEDLRKAKWYIERELKRRGFDA